MYVKYNGFSFFFAFYSSSNINFWRSSSTEVSGLSAQTGLPFLTSFKTSSQSLGTVGSLHSPTSSVKANGTANAAHCLHRWAPYPKPSKQTLRVRLAFLLLVCLRKQAFDTASKQKSLSLCDRLCRAYGNRTRITRMKT